MKKKVKKIVAIILVIVLVVLIFIGYKVVPLLIMKNEIAGSGSYSLEMNCKISDEIIFEYLPILEMTDIDVDNIKLKAQKDGNIYYGELYINEVNTPVLEFYEKEKAVYINISSIIKFIRIEGEDVLPEKILGLLDFEKDIYISGGAIEELVGESDRSLEEFVGEMLDFKFDYSLGIFDGNKRNINGNLQTSKGKIQFEVVYRKDKGIKLDTPDRVISKLDVIIIKQIVNMLKESHK